jgi:hypothetical protein
VAIAKVLRGSLGNRTSANLKCTAPGFSLSLVRYFLIAEAIKPMFGRPEMSFRKSRQLTVFIE